MSTLARPAVSNLLNTLSKRAISTTSARTMPSSKTEAERILEGMETHQRNLQRGETRRNNGRVNPKGKAAMIQSELDHVKSESGTAEEAVRNYKRDTALFESIESQESGINRPGGPAAALQSAYNKGINAARSKKDSDLQARKAEKGSSSQLQQDRAEMLGKADHPFYGEFLESKEKI